MTSSETTPVAAIVQVRSNSSRLPHKVLQPILGRQLLLRVVDRLQACPLVERVMVATTIDPSDDAIETLCKRHNLPCYRGEVDQVLNRLIGAARAFNCERFLRVCGDNPFLDPGLMAQQLEAFCPEDDYCSFFTATGEPIITKPIGLFAEAVSLAALQRVLAEAEEPMYTEHATMFIYRKPDRFRIRKLSLPAYIDPELRFTIDYPEDVHFCERVLLAHPNPTAKEIMSIVRSDVALEQELREFSASHRKTYA